ncbi:MAG: hypothetical protein HY673_04165 [Chloroflexi bacterium]|nr:hypothetical protein [Chloroflexota bacterium]
MSREAVEDLLDRWLNEPAFRAELRANPEGTVRLSGAALNEEEWAAFRSINWDLSDEELELMLRESEIPGF